MPVLVSDAGAWGWGLGGSGGGLVRGAAASGGTEPCPPAHSGKTCRRERTKAPQPASGLLPAALGRGAELHEGGGLQLASWRQRAKG